MVFRKLRNLVAGQVQAAASKETANNQPSSDDEQPEPISVRSPCSLATAAEVPAIPAGKRHLQDILGLSWNCLVSITHFQDIYKTSWNCLVSITHFQVSLLWKLLPLYIVTDGK